MQIVFSVSMNEHVVGQELLYDSQYATSGTGLFANFNCDDDYSDLLFVCNTTSCKTDPLVVNCIRGR